MIDSFIAYVTEVMRFISTQDEDKGIRYLFTSLVPRERHGQRSVPVLVEAAGGIGRLFYRRHPAQWHGWRGRARRDHENQELGHHHISHRGRHEMSNIIFIPPSVPKSKGRCGTLREKTGRAIPNQLNTIPYPT